MSVEKSVSMTYCLFHRGRENAITREKFQEIYSYLLGGIDDREFREIYARLPILTCKAGGYWPKRGAEVLEFAARLDKIRASLQGRKCRVLKAHRNLLRDPELEARLQLQGRLFQ